MITVVKIKDIIKYLTILTVVIMIIIGARNLIKDISSENIAKEKLNLFNLLKIENLSKCIETELPIVGIVNKNSEYKEDYLENYIIAGKESSIIEKILNVELSIINVKKEMVESQNKVDEVYEENLDNVEIIEQIEKIAQNGESIQDTKIELAEDNLQTEVIEDNNIKATYTNTYGSVEVKNQSKYDLTLEMLTPDIEIENKENILIFHTHTCESYTPSENYNYEMTGNFRTTDLDYSVARVGEELKNYLTAYNFNVFHDETYHDYPAYTGSYNRSLQTVQSILKENPANIIIDLHRDAVGSNSEYAPKVKIGDEYAAQLMFVIGTDGGGLIHDNWNQNLKFAVKVQEKANELYPGLFRPIILRDARYNQHVSSAATIIEVGATGNTLDECLASMKYLAKILSEV